MKKHLHLIFLVLCLAPLQALAALYGTTHGNSTLLEIDPVTGATISTIGSVGYRVNGMTYDETTGTMYATTSTSDGSFPDGLITINLTTGAGTPVGIGAGQLVNVPAANSSGALYGWTEDTDDLVLWNKAAGTITVLPDSLGTSEQSLAFDVSDTLYYVSLGDDIQIINTATGAATPGLAITGDTGNTLHHGDFAPGTSLLYAITDTNSTASGPGRTIDILDVTTGNVTGTIAAPDNLHTLAFTSGAVGPGPAGASSIPTMSVYGLLLSMFGLIIVASRRLRA